MWFTKKKVSGIDNMKNNSVFRVSDTMIRRVKPESEFRMEITLFLRVFFLKLSITTTMFHTFPI